MSNYRHKHFTTEELQAEFRAYSRAPFMEVLASLMDCHPSPEAIQSFADRYPDKWAGAIKVMSQLAGYHEQIEVKGNIHMQISAMGDAQLMKELEELNGKLVQLSPNDFEQIEHHVAKGDPVLAGGQPVSGPLGPEDSKLDASRDKVLGEAGELPDRMPAKPGQLDGQPQ